MGDRTLRQKTPLHRGGQGALAGVPAGVVEAERSVRSQLPGQPDVLVFERGRGAAAGEGQQAQQRPPKRQGHHEQAVRPGVAQCLNAGRVVDRPVACIVHRHQAWAQVSCGKLPGPAQSARSVGRPSAVEHQ